MGSVEKLKPEDFKLLRDYIYANSGLFFSDAKVYFVESRVSKRLKEHDLTSYQDYLTMLKRPGSRNEHFKLFDAVTTNETSFYRNPPQVDAFANDVLPKVVKEIKARGQRTLRIWSAACSSGEEPYTLAMILEDKKSLLEGLRIEVHGTDISQEILAKCRGATYQAYTMRNLSDKYKRLFFTKDGDNFKITDSVKKKVRVAYFNLVDYPGYIKYRNMDIIFCRNVLIYFDIKVKREIVKSFYNSLNKDGYLFIGHSESLHNVNRDLKMEHYTRALAYRKPS